MIMEITLTNTISRSKKRLKGTTKQLIKKIFILLVIIQNQKVARFTNTLLNQVGMTEVYIYLLMKFHWHVRFDFGDDRLL
jgi:hypothetical protein